MFVLLKEILDLREGMTAELRYRPADDRHSPSNHRAKPQAVYGANRRTPVYVLCAWNSPYLHQETVNLQLRNIAAFLLAEMPLVSLVNASLGDLFSAPGALATVHQHCTGSAAIYLRCLLSNANHHFGGQL